MIERKQTSILILAAGNSSRLGRPKQSVTFEGKTLLEKTIQAGKISNAQSTYVVLGFSYNKLMKDLDLSHEFILINEEWNLGMGNSLKYGVSKIMELEPKTEAIIVSVCDQPYLSASIFNGLLGRFQGDQKIVASYYSGIQGVPALFSKTYFKEILNLQDESGAKYLLNKYKERVVSVAFEKGEIDIDTPDDLSLL
ncbi:MAG: nucleotidyltransferase family protein [Bacteroidota bacterium]